MVSVRHLDEAGPDVSEELLCGLVLGAVHLPSRHLTDAVLGPLEILKAVRGEEIVRLVWYTLVIHLVGQISVIVQVKESLKIQHEFVFLKF